VQETPAAILELRRILRLHVEALNETQAKIKVN
jgi:hypothetical protein